MVLHVILQLCILIHYYIDNIFDWIFSLYYTSLKEKVKGVDNRLLLESAVSLSRKIRERKLKSEELVQLFINRIIDVNPLLNAVVDTRFDEAIKEAKEVDDNIANGKYTEEDYKNMPFLGVPFTTKESTKCKGLRHTLAIKIRANVIADEDAEIITKMKNAGGILLGVSNIPQVNMWVESNNPIYGRTKNPYDTTRNVGGSSGGEGSIVAACGSAIGLGTDIGGSIRIPAFMNGIFGFKCSPDMVSTKGTTYRTGEEGPTMVVAGPMAKYMDDIIMGFKVLLEKDKIEILKLNDDVDLKELNFFYSLEIMDPLISQIRPVMKDCVERAVKFLSEYTEKEVKLVEFDGMKYTTKLWTYQLKQENHGKADFSRDIANRERSVGLLEATYDCFIKNEYTIPILYNLLKKALVPVNETLMKEVLTVLKNEVETKLGENGVLIFPSWAFQPEYHNLALLRPVNLGYTSIWNTLKLPTLQVPMGLSEDGLPLGLQVVAGTNQDRLCFAVGQLLERAFGGYVPPFIAPVS